MGITLEQRFRSDLLSFQRLSYIHESPMEKLKELGFSYDDVIDCSLGTNPYGSSSLVIDSLERMDWSHIRKYPDPSYHDLVSSLQSFWNPMVQLDAEHILIGSGTSGILEKILKATITNQTMVFGYSPQFTEFATEVAAQGGIYRSIPLMRRNQHSFDPEYFIHELDPSVSIVYIDNPNNPTGQVIPLNVIEMILRKAHDFRQLVIMDEAYGDFVSKEHSALQLAPEFDNLITVRSFSKGSGLANLRVGYAVSSSKVLNFIRKVDLPFAISTSAALAAQISLQDEQFIFDCRSKIALEKKKLMDTCSGFYFASTHPEVPILLMASHVSSVNLGNDLFHQGILTESGADFISLDASYVRLRIPQETDRLIKRLNQYIESINDS